MMKLTLISLGAGLLVGLIYSLLGVRSPAPPVIALVGLAGILLGEQLVPIAKRLADRTELVRFFQKASGPHVLGSPPIKKDRDA